MKLRTKETHVAYQDAQSSHKNFSQTKDYTQDQERILKEYTHWYIIPNLYPYDQVTKIHDMLVPRRVFSRMSECNKNEWDEYLTIIAQLEQEKKYDALIENFAKGRSVLRHLHLHLVIWK